MKSYAPIVSLVTSRDGTCPEGYVEVESPVVNGFLQARIAELEAKLRLTEGAFKNTRIAELEAILRDALPAERAQHALNRKGEPHG